MPAFTRKIATLAALAFALGTPALQAIAGLGLDQAEFAEAGDSTLRAAPYAFSIWGLIYAGLIAYGVRQAVAPDSPLFRAVGWPAVIAITGCGAWIVASALDARWASVAIILVSAAGAITALLRAANIERPASWLDRWTLFWPLGLLAGWLTTASALNILTVLTAEGLISGGAALPAAAAGLVAVCAVCITLVRRTIMPIIAVPVAWGLVGVFAAEQSDNEPVAYAALMGAALVAGFAAWLAAKRPMGLSAPT